MNSQSEIIILLMGNSNQNQHPKYPIYPKAIYPMQKYLCFHQRPEYKLLMVSLDGAGKTTMLYNLFLGQIISTVPTIGFNVQQVEFEKNSLIIWQVAGGCMIRQLWHHYLQMVKGIVFVIDLSDSQRLVEALHCLMNLLIHQKCQDKYLFIIGNKKDMASPQMIGNVEKAIKQLDICQKYRIKYLSAFNREEIIQVFREISEIFAIVK